MPANFTIPLVTVIPGQTITASGWNGEFENIDTNFTPAGVDDYSATDSQMQTQTDPYPASATSRPTSTAGEFERIRYVLSQLSGKTYWYQDPDISIASFKTNFDAHTHDGTTNNGPQLQAAGLASNSVTTAKILDANVTTAKIANAAVTETQLATSVAGNGLAGGAGTPLSVNVDSSTIEISGDTLQVKDGGITGAKIASSTISSAKLDSSVPAAVGLKSIQSFSVSVSIGNGLSTATTNTTITSVNTSKSVAIVTSITQSSGTAQASRFTVSLSSSTNLATTVIIPIASVGTSAFSVGVTVLEFN